MRERILVTRHIADAVERDAQLVTSAGLPDDRFDIDKHRAVAAVKDREPSSLSEHDDGERGKIA